MSLKIASDFALDLDVAGEAVAILAKRGAGKTNTATVLVEELVRNGVQVVVLDPVGAWWGIRAGADGEAKGGLGVPVLGGRHGDVPLEQTAGALIAQVAVETEQSLLLDLSDFPTKAAVARFVTDFAEKLYALKGRSDSLLHLVLEEADSFAPQKVKGNERMQGAIEQLVRRGRSRGIGITMVTQRSAVLSKDVLTQADVLVVMRTTGPHDLRAIREWVDARDVEHGSEVMPSLPGLATGEAWFWNPERDMLRLVRVRPRRTFDSSRTPRAGERRVEPSSVAPIDLDALGAEIRATAEKVKADDPKALRARIQELTKELMQRPAEVEVEIRTETIEVPVLPPGNTLETVLMPVLKTLPELLERTNAELAKLIAAVNGRESHGTEPVARPPARAPRAEPPARPARREPRRPLPDSGDSAWHPDGPQRRVLNAVRWLESVGIAGERKRVAVVAGYMPSSGGFRNIVSKLNVAGAVHYPAEGVVELTEIGRLNSDEPDPVTSTAELQAKILRKLSNPQHRVLEPLLRVYPEALDRGELATLAGYEPTSGGFRNLLSELKTLDLVTYPGTGLAAASSVLFLD